MLEIFDDVEQGSEAWRLLRCGLPTASVFKDILAKPREPGKGMRVSLLRALAGEVITGEPAESYSNSFMDRGKRVEPEARALYAMLCDDEVRPIGFMRRPGVAGASPDAIVGERGGLEIKSVTAAIMVEVLDRGSPPPEHVAQVQGSLWISGRSWWDLMIYHSDTHKRMPHRVFRLEPDADYFARLETEIGRFNDDLRALVERVRAYGQPQQEAA